MFYALKKGTEVTLAFLHALPLDSRMFQPQIDAFRERATIYAADYPGFGGTPANRELRFEDYARGVLAEWDRLGIRRAVVAGVSMGAQLALWIAAHHPERIEKLVISSTHALPPAAEERQMFLDLAQAVETHGPAALADQLIGMLFSEAARSTKPEVIASARRMIEEADGVGVATAFRALANRPDPTPWFSQIRVPTLLIYGEFDGAIPPAHIEALHQGIASSELHRLQTGHYPNLEAPEAYNARIERFVFKN
ncbi:alpha/beta hydrolase [Hydrogenibacillus schlegelii]|uniref:AB hydrolase-1 domain-containing protein n=1 Tax=Hydrogenibacillus schlegelii TaxID=1484 RepID=A0A132MGU0_HYDSH|nr:alpha/beta hydrolase [Hydrogenibacillus schlegelii]KWW97013.1 hypothetical protein TR75_11035 [Hydrogenibacillus schlegelii]OAR05195.1 hypothetical protein SA87_05345 [Hydrogenibacillus schlegelii]